MILFTGYNSWPYPSGNSPVHPCKSRLKIASHGVDTAVVQSVTVSWLVKSREKYQKNMTSRKTIRGIFVSSGKYESHSLCANLEASPPGRWESDSVLVPWNLGNAASNIKAPVPYRIAEPPKSSFHCRLSHGGNLFRDDRSVDILISCCLCRRSAVDT